MAAEIHANQRRIRMLRIHESGDFYSQEYLNAWYTLARTFPAITFYAYTKSFHLDFAGRPANMRLIASYDPDSSEPATLPAHFTASFTIIARGLPATCIQDCTACSKCVEIGQRLTVNVH